MILTHSANAYITSFIAGSEHSYTAFIFGYLYSVAKQFTYESEKTFNVYVCNIDTDNTEREKKKVNKEANYN